MNGPSVHFEANFFVISHNCGKKIFNFTYCLIRNEFPPRHSF